MIKKYSPIDIDKLLPQTQCGLCEYSGCFPYAEAISQGEAPINKCLPGGVRVLKQLGELLSVDPSPYWNDMLDKQKMPSVASIDENLCIGCVKCIQACPVDAIIGSAKMMHTVLTSACTGCELCVPVCPMDCIHMYEIPTIEDPVIQQARAEQARDHYYRRRRRLQIDIVEEKKRYVEKVNPTVQASDPKKAYIEAALLRVKQKKKG
jgi:Na+-translocating ferredoxin:NAD+ oxidoreductase subunit B